MIICISYKNRCLFCLFVCFLFHSLFVCLLINHWLTDDQLVSNSWSIDEHQFQLMINSWSTDGQQFINWWSTVDQPMIICISYKTGVLFCYSFCFVCFLSEWSTVNYWRSTVYWLMINSLSAHDQLMINSWSTDDQQLINWWSTVDQIMTNNWSTNDHLYTI